jgi:hypothetical protein
MLYHGFRVPTHIFGEAIIETSKIHNSFIQYPNNTHFNAFESFQNLDKTHEIFYHFNNNKYYQQLKVIVHWKAYSNLDQLLVRHFCKVLIDSIS